MPRTVTRIAIATGTVLMLATGGTCGPVAAAPLMAPKELSVPARSLLLQRAWFCRCEREWAPRLYWQWGRHHPPWQTPWNEPTYFWSLDPPRVPADLWARKWHLPRLRRRWDTHRVTGGRR